MKQKNLETSDFSVKEEIQKIRSLPKEKRFEYIWEYYKAAFFIIAFGIFFLWMMTSFLVNMFIGTFFPKDPVSIGFSLSHNIQYDDWVDRCLIAIGYDEKEENLQVLEAAPYSESRDDFIIQSTVWFTAGQPDIFIVNEDAYQHLLGLEVLADFRTTWPEELQQLAQDRMVSPYALDISGTPFAEEHAVRDDPLYLCMFVGGHGFQRALDIVEYLLTES